MAWSSRQPLTRRQREALRRDADAEARHAVRLGNLCGLDGDEVFELNPPTETVGWKVPGGDVRCLACGPVVGAERFTAWSVFATKRCTGCGNPVDPTQYREEAARAC